MASHGVSGTGIICRLPGSGAARFSILRQYRDGKRDLFMLNGGGRIRGRVATESPDMNLNKDGNTHR